MVGVDIDKKTHCWLKLAQDRLSCVHRQENKCSQVNYEVKGQLAKLLATEDLIIENRKVSTASFDVNVEFYPYQCGKRLLESVYDLLVGHEVGHALHTPADNWTIDYPDVPMSYVNVFEDVRIEKLMKQRYAGIE